MKPSCEFCGKRSYLLQECRCNKYYCFNCTGHKCNFDYKKAGREQIAKNNPKIEAEKINKI